MPTIEPTATTPFFGIALVPAFLVFLPLAGVWMHRSFGGAWGRAVLAALLASTAGFMAMIASYTFLVRRVDPGALLAARGGEWVVTRADPPFAVLAALLLAAAAWASAVAVYPARLRPRVLSRSAVLGVAGVLVIAAFFALSL